MGKLLRFPRRRAKDAGAKPLFPGLTAGTDARPAYFASDASAAAIGTRAPADDELQRRLRLRRRGWQALMGAIFVAGVLTALFAERGYLDNKRQEKQHEARRAEMEAHQRRVNELQRDVERLRRDPRAVERIAREDLGYAEKGEILVLLPGEALDATSRSAIVPPVSPKPAP